MEYKGWRGKQGRTPSDELNGFRVVHEASSYTNIHITYNALLFREIPFGPGCAA
jgi:hypothetical protein